MAEKGETNTTTSQESVWDTEQARSKQCQCRCIFVLKPHEVFEREIWYDVILENIRESFLRGWKCVTKQNEVLVLVKCDLSKSLDIQLSDRIVLSNHQIWSPSNTTSSEEAAAAAVSLDLCDCFDTFSTLDRNLNSTEYNQWLSFGICHGKTYVSIVYNEKTLIPVDDFHKLDVLVSRLISLGEDVKAILNTRIPLGETEEAVGSVITSHVTSQEEFFKEINELVFQKRNLYKLLNSLVVKYCGSVAVLGGSVNSSVNVEAPQPPPEIELRGPPGGGSIPLRILLQCIIVRLTPFNWVELRLYVGRDIPSRVLLDIPNNIEFFQELENRNMIRIGNTDYIREGLYEIERVDLVHLLDCIQDGDYSLLIADIARERRNRAEANGGIVSSSLVTSAQPPVRQMQTLTVGGKMNANAAGQGSTSSRSAPISRSPEPRSRDVVQTDGPDNSNDKPLERRYRNIPQSTTPSSSRPVQEHIDGERPLETGTSSSAESTHTRERNSGNVESDGPNASSSGTNSNDASTQGNNSEEVSSQRTTAEGTNSEGTNSEDTTPRGALAQATNAGNVLPLDANTEGIQFSCEHYDRYCFAQFPCCPEFWPCHRCHNNKSKCGQKKLRSRDIKTLKCRRCGKEQDFPKESGHCVACNLKFAEYFCPICKHLTGVQNHPFHCEKCGICRVRGDRSFHCDICGVCLDVQLKGNHKCREGSAHDSCVICKQDAFTGCTLLPCSHKVHKECATQILSNGITRCPACQTSFAHKAGKSHKP